MVENTKNSICCLIVNILCFLAKCVYCLVIFICYIVRFGGTTGYMLIPGCQWLLCLWEFGAVYRSRSSGTPKMK
jgi:hypothetical protein